MISVPCMAEVVDNARLWAERLEGRLTTWSTESIEIEFEFTEYCINADM